MGAVARGSPSAELAAQRQRGRHCLELPLLGNTNNGRCIAERGRPLEPIEQLEPLASEGITLWSVVHTRAPKYSGRNGSSGPKKAQRRK